MVNTAYHTYLISFVTNNEQYIIDNSNEHCQALADKIRNRKQNDLNADFKVFEFDRAKKRFKSITMPKFRSMVEFHTDLHTQI